MLKFSTYQHHIWDCTFQGSWVTISSLQLQGSNCQEMLRVWLQQEDADMPTAPLLLLPLISLLNTPVCPSMLGFWCTFSKNRIKPLGSWYCQYAHSINMVLYKVPQILSDNRKQIWKTISLSWDAEEKSGDIKLKNWATQSKKEDLHLIEYYSSSNRKLRRKLRKFVISISKTSSLHFAKKDSKLLEFLLSSPHASPALHTEMHHVDNFGMAYTGPKQGTERQNSFAITCKTPQKTKRSG